VGYRIEVSPEAGDHIARLSARDRAIVLDAIGAHLAQEPTRLARNRKPMRPNPVAQYRLRVGRLRVYYDIEETPRQLVIVKAVGIKIRERVYVGGREIEL
jgi:mRNA-degrading endonuclease RelE of RelBE toxin-antitoxin system